jgi:hypothetical protein
LPQEPQVPPSHKLALFAINLDDLFVLFARKRDIQAGLFELAGEELCALLCLGVFVYVAGVRGEVVVLYQITVQAD